jgi:hypothetical protein
VSTRSRAILIQLLALAGAIAALALGALGIALALLLLTAAGSWLVGRDVYRHRAALRAHLAGREAIPVPAQIEAFLRQSGHEPAPDTVLVISARWHEVARMLGLPAALMRPGDSLREDYEPLRSSLRDPPLPDHLELEVARREESADPVLPTFLRCRSCGYDLAGLPRDSLCPECGKPVLYIRTLGDYLLFVARVIPEAPRGPAPK